MASNNEVILEEIEALQAIMMDEVIVHYADCGQPNAVEVTVKPATAENINEQHVRVTLILNLPQNYPDQAPSISLRNPRGIDEAVLAYIKEESKKKCVEFSGFPIIYELIELVRENLTANNAPSCPCAICLFHFTDNDSFSKTECFHYFHSYCLGRYVANCEETAAAEEKEDQQPLWVTRTKKQIVCPVCREPIIQQIDCNQLLQQPQPEEGEYLKDFCAEDPDIKALQQRFAAMFQCQKLKGGIIDLEEERNKFLISSSGGDSTQTAPARCQRKCSRTTTSGANLAGTTGQQVRQPVKNTAQANRPQVKKHSQHGNRIFNGAQECVERKGGTNYRVGGTKNHRKHHVSERATERNSRTISYTNQSDIKTTPLDQIKNASHSDTQATAGRLAHKKGRNHRGGGGGGGGKMRGAPPGFKEVQSDQSSPALS